MNTEESKSDWEVQKEKLKQKFDELIQNDLLFREGTKEQLIEKLQKKLGKTREELLKIIDGL